MVNGWIGYDEGTGMDVHENLGVGVERDGDKWRVIVGHGEYADLPEYGTADEARAAAETLARTLGLENFDEAQMMEFSCGLAPEKK